MTMILLLINLAQGPTNSSETEKELERLWQNHCIEQRIEALVQESFASNMKPTVYVGGSLGYRRLMRIQENPTDGIALAFEVQSFQFPQLKLSLSDSQNRLRTRLREALTRLIQKGTPVCEHDVEKVARQVWKGEQDTIEREPMRDSAEWPLPGHGFQISFEKRLMKDEFDSRLGASVGIGVLKLGLLAGLGLGDGGTQRVSILFSSYDEKVTTFWAIYGCELAVPLFLNHASPNADGMQWFEPFVGIEARGLMGQTAHSDRDTTSEAQQIGPVFTAGIRMSLGIALPEGGDDRESFSKIM